MKIKSLLVITCLFGILITNFGFPAQSYGKTKIDYQQEMRGLIKEINYYAKTRDKAFKVIVNNGTDLLIDQEGKNKTVAELIDNIDGLLLESHNYGWEMRDDTETPQEVRAQQTGPLALLKFAHKVIFSIDYCQDPANVNNSYAQNDCQEIVSFAANSRQLDSIPTFPAVVHGVNRDSITELSQAKNLLVLLNPQNYQDKASYLKALRNTDYDLLIVDAYYNDNLLTKEDVQSLKFKKNGGVRLVLAYMSVGEAEDYRTYWQSSWSKKPPAWLMSQNPDWPGNYKVKYWDTNWKNILFGSPRAYLDGIMTAGFNGVFLDVVDAYQYFAE